MRYISGILIIHVLFLFSSLVAQDLSKAKIWLTSPDQAKLLSAQQLNQVPSDQNEKNPVIDIILDQKFQTIDGFGFTLTGGSAELIHQMPALERKALLVELFGTSESSIGISCLRISLGASDLSNRVFSYDDLAPNKTDLTLSHFSLSDDTLHLIPLLKEILGINPGIFIMASPWSPPIWMKTSKSSKGGKLEKQYYDVYARYMLRYVQEMGSRGINIAALTLQNEPHHGGNNPSMVMEPEDQALFVGQYLGPLFEENSIKTRIVIWDHNCDEPNYPISVLKDEKANLYIDGSAFHLYAGKINALSNVKEAFPEKNLYFTEQWTGKNGTFSGDLQWHVKHVIIGSMQNWSRMALEWNFANDPGFGPHTPGGCTECKGALTIDGKNVTRNVAYYIIAHASKFIPAGSVRIGSTAFDGISNVAFLRPDGKIAVVILNELQQHQSFQLRFKDKLLSISLAASEVASIVF